MLAPDLTLASDYFALLHVPRTQAQDVAVLDAHFRELQGRVHPDKHAHATTADQRLAMQWATRVNEAYQALKHPLARARYLLGLLGHDVAVETNTAMPPEFLMAQMELREAVEDAQVGAGDTAIRQLETLLDQLHVRMRAEQAELVRLIDTNHDYAAACDLVRQLMFQEKLRDEIDAALDRATA
ncbi:MAG: Fe-S protein assembly co-chaperone HscB [Rhodocyclaceae bacterium]|jgi:molecular chaperone HscB|nr:Fe-S protein assembly co-chaperone HscB [Rhodocyclaceae bacterium]